ncbi:MAG: hypothetical protein KDK23_14690 [Leptospiraceae bacterium]|nr:hypothetical protein [Leptospiraceae bacterium]
MKKALVALAAASLVYCGGSDSSTDGDPMELTKKDPKHTAVLLENEYGAVLQIELPAGAEQPQHYGASRIVYSLSDYSLDWLEEGKESRVDWKTGDIHEHDPGIHRAKNVGSTTAIYLIVLRKKAKLDPVQAMEAPSKFHQQIHKSSEFIVYEVRIPAGEAIPSHPGFPRFVYSLTDYTVEYTEGEERGTHSFKKGDVHFHESKQQHSAANAGDSEARFLVVVPRK